MRRSRFVLLCLAAPLAAQQPGPPRLIETGELADLIHHARFRLIRGAGHLPPVDRPREFAAELVDFLRHIGVT